ncbi:MAG: RHS repeat-associated core domain-containing protein [Actinobacteria bacterium]|nr:RHS repeat-associated core domain-containing protein [Actinomycetota bacterium]
MSEKKTAEYINDPSRPVSQVLQTVDEKGKTDTFIFGLQRIAKVNDKSRAYDEAKADYYLYDALGSVTGLTNEKGALTAKYSYNEFGIPTASSKFGQGGERSNTYGYTGEDFDQTTGLLYLRARYYSPETGRFIRQDPTPNVFGKTTSQNRYVYVDNNPLAYIDPLGLWGEKIHYDKTLEWAVRIGFSDEDARVIALSDKLTDTFFEGEGRHLNENYGSVFGRGDPTQLTRAMEQLDKAIQARLSGRRKDSLVELGIGLHSVQDLVAHGEIPGYGSHYGKIIGYNPDYDYSGNRLEATEMQTYWYLAKYLLAVSEK